MSNQSFSEAELVAEITGGFIPLKCCFICKDEIYTWNPRDRYLSVLLIDDDPLYHACLTFLRSRAAVINDINDIPNIARQQQWPEWELLQPKQHDH
jgi:hypothetical protein